MTKTKGVISERQLDLLRVQLQKWAKRFCGPGKSVRLNVEILFESSTASLIVEGEGSKSQGRRFKPIRWDLVDEDFAALRRAASEMTRDTLDHKALCKVILTGNRPWRGTYIEVPDTRPGRQGRKGLVVGSALCTRLRSMGYPFNIVRNTKNISQMVVIRM